MGNDNGVDIAAFPLYLTIESQSHPAETIAPFGP